MIRPGRCALGPLLLLVAWLPTAAFGDEAAFRVVRAPEWEAFFDRDSGWTGADGGFSIPLSGVYVPGSGDLGPTVFTFGDTFIGEIDPLTGERLPGWTIVNNTLSLYSPGAHAMGFLWGHDAGEAKALFVPETPNSEPGEWYWPADGFANLERGGDLYITYIRLEGPGFRAVGSAFVVLPRDSRDPIAEHRQIETPLFRAADGGRQAMTLGLSLIANTEWAGAPAPDGFLYAYGHEETPFKKALVGRIRPAEIEDPTAWRYWDGRGWVEEYSAAEPLFQEFTGNFSFELLPDGRVISLWADFGGHLYARIGESVSGPFAPAFELYRTPEVDLDPDIFTYNPIAHSHLSDAGELLINYSVNSFQFGDLITHADWFRPKFIRVLLTD